MKFSSRVWNGLLVLVASVSLLLSFPGIVRAQREDTETEFEQEFKKTSQLIVMVTVKFSREEEFGAGIIFGREKDRLLIATAYHVLHKQAEHPPVLVELRSMPGKPLNATLLKYDAAADLAVLSVEKQGINVCALPFDRLGDAAQLKRKDAVSAVGNPNGVKWAMPVEPDKISEITPTAIVFQSNFISKGHSGGALLNESGTLVGMTLADQPPFGRAANIDGVLQLVKQWGYPVQLQAALKDGKTLLHHAADRGDATAIKNLLALCGDANAKDNDGVVPLHLAAAFASTEEMLLLVKAGADLNAVDRSGDTPLHWAAYFKSIEGVRFLIKAGAKVNAISDAKKTPLHLAVERRPQHRKSTFAEEKARWLEVINFLVGAGAKVDATALYDLLDKGEVEDLKILLKAVSDLNLYIDRPNALDDPGGTLLHSAARRGQLELVELLLKAGADVNSPGHHGETATYVAFQSGKTAVQDLLIAHGGRLKSP